MKTKIIFLSLICLFITATNLSASSFSAFYPGGKNYLEYDNFSIDFDTITSNDRIKVKSNTVYTLSIPGDGSIENPYFLVESDSEVYIDGYVDSLSNCDFTLNYANCTFTTSTDEDEYLFIVLEGMFLGGMFSYYDGQDFQLEEGPLRTEYEEYIVPLMDSENPEFSGFAAFIMAYHDSYDIEDIIADHIVVIDDIDGDISDSIEITSDDYTPNKNVVGEYLVELQASDQSGNTAYFSLTIIVKDEVLPSILGPTDLNVNIDDGLTIEDIVSSNYTGADGYEGSTVVTVSVDEYSLNESIIGSYDVTLTTEDNSGNVVSKDIVISIVDTDGPQLDSSDMINVYMSDPKEITDIIGELSLIDNYDVASDIVTSILVDDYSSSSNLIGNYSISVLIEDSSLNSTEIALYINVIDDVAPVISGPTSYSISYTTPLTLEQIIELFTVNDNFDDLSVEDLTVIENTYTTRLTDTGIFSFQVEVLDSSLNTTIHTMEITVVDDQAPVIYIDDYIVTLSANASFNPEDALSILVNNHELPNKLYTIAVLNDEYSGNEDNPGTYMYSLLFTDTEGTSLQKDFIVKVSEEKQLVDRNLIVRNVIVYGITITFFGFVVYKNKK